MGTVLYERARCCECDHGVVCVYRVCMWARYCMSGHGVVSVITVLWV